MIPEDPPAPVSRMLGIASLDDAPMVGALTTALATTEGSKGLMVRLQQIIASFDREGDLVSPLHTTDPGTTDRGTTDQWLEAALRRIADLVTARAKLSTDAQLRAIDEELLALLSEHGTEALQTQIGKVLDAAESNAPAIDRIGRPRWIGDYELQDRLGDGAFGVVFRARHRATGQTAAVKLLRLDAATDTRVRRFRDEAHIAGSLDHPGIVRILASGVQDDDGLLLPWIASELVDGVPWNDFAASAPRASMLAAFVAMCRAIEHAHASDVVHRDLKPHNVVVDPEGTPHVLDFGIAKILGANPAHTRSDQLLGTPAYMAPEIARNGIGAASVVSDVWALGAMLFEALAGRPPHDLRRLSQREALNCVATAVPPRIQSLRRGISNDLAAIVTTATSPEQDRRYGSVANLRRDVERYLAGQRVTAKRATVLEDVARFVSRHRTLAIVVATALVATLAGTGTALVQWQYAVRAKGEQMEAAARARAAAASSLDALVAAAQFAQEISERTLVTSRIAQLVEKPLALLESLRAGDSAGDNAAQAADWLRVEADLREIMADAAVRAGKWATAKPLRERVLAIEQQLAGEQTPPPSSLARALVKLGDVARELNDREQLGTVYERAHRIFIAREKAYPNDREAADDLSWSYERIAFLDVFLEPRRQTRGIEMAHQRVALGRRIAAQWPCVTSNHSLAASLVFLLECLDACATEHTAQVDLAQEALTVVRSAMRDDPTRRVIHILHVNALRALARETRLAGDEVAMSAALSELTATADQLLQVDPDDHFYRLVAFQAWNARVFLRAKLGLAPDTDLDELSKRAEQLPSDIRTKFVTDVMTELEQLGFSAAANRLRSLQK